MGRPSAFIIRSSQTAILSSALRAATVQLSSFVAWAWGVDRQQGGGRGHRIAPSNRWLDGLRMSDEKHHRLHCNQCHGERWHVLRTAFESAGSEDLGEEYPESWSDSFEIFQCQGCSSVTVKRSFLFPALGEDPEVSYFPPAISRHEPRRSANLPDDLRHLVQ